MPSAFPPKKDADLLSMAANLSTKISAAPTTYGLTAAQATAFAALNTAFADAYALAIDPATRTRANIAAKDTARTNLIGNVSGIRDINRFVQATRSVTDAQKIELGLPVYSSRSPINPPTDVPVFEVLSNVNRIVTVALRTAGTTRRARPTGVQGAIVLSYQGATPPDDITLWKPEGMSTKTKFPITFSPAIPQFTKIWLTAAWYNPRGQAGTACTPVSIYLSGGVGTGEDELKIAA